MQPSKFSKHRMIRHTKQMRMRWIFYFTLCCGLLLVGQLSFGAPVDTLTITKEVMAAALNNPFGNFLNYRVEGICEWEHWTPLGPYFTTTLEVNEFLPDAVVMVYTNEGKNPWGYANTMVDPIMQKMGDAIAKSIDGVAPLSTNDSVGGGGDMMEKFKEAEIIGDPALLTFFSHLHFAMIPSEATPFVIYYSSLLDTYFWHSPQLDDLMHPQDLLPDVRNEGSAVDRWGAIFPRIGFIDQMGDFKAAAVIALRAADIATNADQSHIYEVLPSGSCGAHCKVWPSHENDFADVKYQEIYPVPTVTAKKVFGVNDLIGHTKDQNQYALGHGNYLWVMWRHYEGCIQGGGQLVGVF